MASEKQRPIRVAARLREEISRQIARELGDPRLSEVIIAKVVVTDDLRLAKIYYRLLTGGTPAKQKEAQAGLERASGRLRKAATAELGLRFAPELRFLYDAGQEARDRIDELLEEVKRETKA